MNKKSLTWALVVLTVVNVVALATLMYHRFEFSREPHRRPGPLPPRHFLNRELHLTPPQAKTMRTLNRTFRREMQPIRVALHRKRAELAKLLMAPEPDRPRIDAVQSEIDSMQADVQRLVIDHLLAQKEMLTSEQQTKFFRIIRQRMLKPPPPGE